MSPGFHLQFSEALSNFALHCAKPVVEAFQGRLIYAGGDDVLAMLPANRAFECASALRDAFQGRSVPGAKLVQKAPGFLQGQKSDDCGEPIPFVVLGEEAECSVGIAIAHFKSPLQDVVRAAQAAEKRAKNQLGRAAVAISLYKRSGEISEWGCRWTDGGLALFEEIARLLESDKLSGKFPHRVCQLLEPYLTARTGLAKQGDVFDAEMTIGIIEKEFRFAVQRQSEAGSEH
ncbi:MAG: type III-B CRISPR-associated protein Cas10/Cmr2, partial [Verrucomicrobia bacterium]|nr:type III-B CRISPR-associated protein Cas10/Cmr2 [Verrucomicrobiota bacterium]